MLTFFVDSDCDVSLKEAKEFGCKMISMPYYVGDKEIKPYVDYEEFDSKAFYDMLREGNIPKTNALNQMDYQNYFEEEFAKGNDIFYVHFSAAMTSSFNSMHLCLEELKEKYPERKFYEVDTFGITLGAYPTTRGLMELYKKGETPENMVKWGEDMRFHYATYFFADDLKFFAKSGRVSNFKSIMGGILNIKPILYMSADGMLTSISKGKGKKGTLLKILSYMDELGDDVANYPIYIGHSDAIELAEEMSLMIKEKYGDNLDIRFVVVNPTAGSHCGPDSIGVSFHAKNR